MRTDETKVEYKPTSVLQVLKEMKNISQLAVDLGYLAVLFNDGELAERLLQLENRIDSTAYQLWMSAALATRDPEDAEKIVGIMKLGSSLDEISNAAADLAKMVTLGLSKHPSLKRVFQRLEDRFGMAIIPPSSKLIGQPIGETGLDTRAGLKILGIKRDKWIINPGDDEVLREGDVLLTKGPESKVEALNQLLRDRSIKVEKIKSYGKVEELLAEIINTTEMMVDLAYGALIYNNVEVAREVIALEEEVDSLHLKLELEVMKRSGRKGRELESLGLIRMGLTCEMISDAAASIADIVVRGLEAHEILIKAFQEVEDTVLMTEVKPGSLIDGKTIEETKLQERFNVKILAVRRASKWLYEPNEAFRITGEDVLIATGLLEGIEEVKRLCSSS
ncbi:MAG: TrkA C-terminal domain-containing protein [Candidatus Bathyarchaeia archaeon]